MNLERLNINVNGIPAPGLVGSDDIFSGVATQFGVSLPNEYIEFIRKVDGGHPENGSFFLHGKTEDSFTVDRFYTFSNPRY